jgi:TolB protein
MRNFFFFIILTISVISCTHHKHKDLKIAYNVLIDENTSNYEVFIMNADGTDKRNLSNHSGVDWVYYAWKDKIYFISDRGTSAGSYFLYEMDWNGENVRKVYTEELYDSYLNSRKEGSEFILSVKKDGSKAFVIIDSDGNELNTVFQTQSYRYNDPAFSPDGKKIVFRSYKSGSDELWIMDENGENQFQLTHYPENDSTAGEHFYRAGPPRWNIHKNKISYTSRQNNNYSIFTVKPDGTDQKQITPDGFEEGWHDWSPNGKLLVYDGSPIENPNYDIYIMNAHGTGVKRLTSGPEYEQSPVFVVTDE